MPLSGWLQCPECGRETVDYDLFTTGTIELRCRACAHTETLTLDPILT